MTTRVTLSLAEPHAGLSGLLPSISGAARIQRSETVRDKLVIVEYAAVSDGSGDEQVVELFADLRLEVIGAAEQLVLEKHLRVREEVVIQKSVYEHTHIVAATLRHHEAEITLTGNNVFETEPVKPPR